jgi:hypothetical protein
MNLLLLMMRSEKCDFVRSGRLEKKAGLKSVRFREEKYYAEKILYIKLNSLELLPCIR